MNETTLDKLIRQSCNEIAEEEYRELAHIGEGQEYVPSKRLRRKMRRLLRHHKINNAGYPGAQPEERTDGTIDAKIAEKTAANTDEKTSKGRNKILHPIYWSKRTAVALLAVVVMAFGAMVTFGAKDIDSWLDELSFEYNDGYETIEQNGWTFTSPSKLVGCGKSQSDNGNTLPGALEIYPAVMVEGQVYEWRRGTAICEALPEDCVYYGEVSHAEGDVPANDCDFVSVFLVSGQIYTVPNDAGRIYLCLTTDWMENSVVVFDIVK